MQVLLTHLGFQQESVESNAKTLSDLKEQVRALTE